MEPTVSRRIYTVNVNGLPCRVWSSVGYQPEFLDEPAYQRNIEENHKEQVLRFLASEINWENYIEEPA